MYDCSEKAGWACYLSFNDCFDSVINVSDLVFTEQPRTYDILSYPGTIVLDADRPGFRMEKAAFYQKFNKLQDSLVAKGYINISNDMEALSYSSIMSIAAKHLFKLNAETKHKTRAMNVKAYPGLFTASGLGVRKYVALQIRLQDKKYEMSAAQWAWMTNVSNIAYFALPYLTDIQDLFIATDNCSTVPVMQSLLPSTVTVHSSCKANTVNEQGIKRNGEDSLKVFADIQMLRHGAHFIGLFESNLVRLVHLIRYPHSLTSHALATEGSGDRKRVDLNQHMDDINYFDS